MTTPAFDTQKASREIKDSGLDDVPAEAIVDVILASQDNLATKSDVHDVARIIKAELKDVKDEMKSLTKNTKADMEAFRKDYKVDTERFKAVLDRNIEIIEVGFEKIAIKNQADAQALQSRNIIKLAWLSCGILAAFATILGLWEAGRYFFFPKTS